MCVSLGYVILSMLNLWCFHRYKSFYFTRFFQLSVSMLLPFLLQWILEGFVSLGSVMLWGMLALIGSVTLLQGYDWLFFFVLLTLFSFWLDPQIIRFMPEIFTPMILKNIIMILTIVFALSKAKVDQVFLIKPNLTRQIKKYLSSKKKFLSDRSFCQKR